MGSSNSKKPDITIKSIRHSTEDIRSSLRRKQIPIQNKENLHQALINNSKQLDTLRAKKSKKKQLEIDQLQKFVSDVSEELLEYNDEHLDKSADESHSFIHVDPKTLKNEKKNTPKMNKTRTNSRKETPLNEIEQKLSKVKNDVTVGIKNEDNKILLLQKKKIEMLSTDLELLNIPETSQLYDRKENLEKDLYKYYQRIIRREKNQSRLSQVSTKENVDETERTKMNSTRLNALEIMLQDIKDVLENSARGDNRGDIQAVREELKKIDSKLGEIEDNNRDTLKSKTILLKKSEELKKTMDAIGKKKEMNELDEIMEQIDILKATVQSEDKSNKDDVIKNITDIKNTLKTYPTQYTENEKFKNEYLDELKRFLDKIEPNHDGVMMRQKKLKHSKSLEDILHLQEEWTNLEKNISLTKIEEVKKVDSLLSKFEESIRKKRNSIADLLKKKPDVETKRKSAEIIRTSAKIFDLPKVQTTKSKEDVSEKTESISPFKYGTIEHALEEVAKISDRVEEIGKNILNFKGTTEDLEYNFFKASLIDKKQFLHNLTHRSSWNQVDVFKLEILEKIGYLEEYLMYKLNQNILELKLKEKLDNLDSKIKRFTGSYQNIHFRSIDNELTACFKEADIIDTIETSEWFKQRTNYLKNILKERSQVDTQQNQHENLTDTRKIITEGKEYIQKLIENVKSASSLDKAEASIIEECLLSKTLELVNLNLKDDTPMFQDVKKLLEEIERCKELIKVKENELNKKSLEDIELNLEKIQNDISEFEGLPTNKEFLDLNKQLHDLEIKLGSIEKNYVEEGKSLELSLRINLLKTRLDQVALDSEQLFEIENRIKRILEKVSEGVAQEDFDKLDEELINLRIQLEKFEVSEKLSYRKIACLSYIEYLLKKINEDLYGRAGHISTSIIV